jgi:hypothetical protein
MTICQINNFIYTNISNEVSNLEIQNTLSILFDSLQVLEDAEIPIVEINFGIEMINNFERSDSMLSDASTVVD